MVSRLTGLGKIAAIATVLGPTYLGNVYQATNLLPNLTYEFLTGSLFPTLLVPPLVRHADAGDRGEIERLAGGFLGVSLLVFSLVALVVVLAAPLVMTLISVGVPDSAAVGQRRVGTILLVMFMPQVLLYGIAGTAGAVLNAQGRFALAAAAPVLENIGIIFTMVATAVIFGTGITLESAGTPELVLLGLGTTAAVALHAAMSWWGARSAGVRLVPRGGWRDPQLVAIVRRAVPSLGYAGLNALRVFATVVVTNRVRGGVVAFQLARNFVHLPVAVGARPVALALLPELSRLFGKGRLVEFRDHLLRGARLILLTAVPASAFYLVLSSPLARGVSFGAMDANGTRLVAASLAALALGVLGQAGFVLGTHASYAQNDAQAPFRAMVARTAVSLIGMGLAFLVEDVWVLVVTGAAMSLADLLSAWQLNRKVLSRLPSGSERLFPAVLRAVGASAAMLLPAYASVSATRHWEAPVLELATVVLAGVLATGTFFAVQLMWRPPEMAWLASALRRARSSRTSSSA